jgi:hypothetical protein
MAFSLSLLVLPLCLHKPSREVLLRSSRSYFLKTVSDHPELLVGFARRATDLLPFTFEGLGLLAHVDGLHVENAGKLRPKPAGFRKSLSGTSESIDCQRAARFVGREFARIGDRVTIYTTLGVRP